MHGNTPYAGLPETEFDAEQRRALRRTVTAVTAETRALLPDEFVVGSEIVDGENGPRATVAVRPPTGSVVSADLPREGTETFATELAAAAAFEVKRLPGRLEGAR
jgi:hypothetical protein